jgi:RNase P/RNase MRP subunit p29
MTRVIWCYLFSADNRPRLVQGKGAEFRLEFAGGRTVRFDGEWLVGGGAE